MTTTITALTASLDFLRDGLAKQETGSGKPLVIGVSGPQGSGKSYLSLVLEDWINNSHFNLNARVISLDDLYVTHEEQLKLNQSDNSLLKGRGLPGTHDLNLFDKIDKFIKGETTEIYVPKYDKSLFNGEGDRVEGEKLELHGSDSIDVLILEGWFFGFKDLSEDEIKAKYTESKILEDYSLKDILEINENLKKYEGFWNLIDFCIFYSTDDINNVLRWRTEQEHNLIREKGSGMTDLEIENFIRRYNVIYDLYYWNFVNEGVPNKKNLKISIEFDRSVKKVEILE